MNLAERFAAAPFEDDGWDTALKALASATRSGRGNLLAMGDRNVSFNWITDMPDGILEQQVAIDGYRPETNYRIAVSAGAMQMRWEAHYDEVRAQGDFEPYIDLVRSVGGEHGAQMTLLDEPGAFFGLGVLRDDSDGRTTEEDRRILQDAAPHVLSAIRVQSALEHQGGKMLCGSLEAMETAAVMMDRQGRVCCHTSAAEAIFTAGNIFVAQGSLRARRPELDEQLQARIAAALRIHLSGSPNAVPELWIPSPTDPVLVKATPLPKRDWSFGVAPAVSVVLRAPVRKARHDCAALMGALNLTRAEAEVVALLVSGMSRQAIANARGTSLQTVVTQLRTVFQKCHVRREVELVSLVRPILDDEAL